jgi:hypothetical protein
MNSNVRVVLFCGMLFLLTVQMPLLGACTGQEPVVPVCATYQAPDGTWMEEDDEPVDADPCDLDDAFEVEHLKTPKPVVKKSPAVAQSAQPLGGKKKRF